jgi:leucyl aminopeptidase
MKPELIHSIGTVTEFPVICIIGNTEIPSFLGLSEEEKSYAHKRFAGNKDTVFINSYSKYTALARIKNEIPQFRQHEELRKAAVDLRKDILEAGFKTVMITGFEVDPSMVLAFTEGMMLSLYKFDKYRKPKPDEKSLPEKIIINANIPETDFLWLKYSCEAVYAVRDMINEPPLKMNAHAFSEEIKRMGSSGGFSVEIFDKNRIAALRMGGLLGVNSGSIDPPRFCIMEYKPANAINKKPLILIGKGVVLDTGGLNIKTGNYMDLMKTDMAGGAAVTGAMYLIARTGIPLHVVALVPVTDNRPGLNAIAPGDILTMHNGTTVEILNTDAEGRLILADAVSYASKYDPMLIITVATLTGSAAMAFGKNATAMMGTAPDEYMDAMISAGEEVFERIAPMPFWEEYSESLKSDVADIQNVGDREGGAIVAGRFVASFTASPFIHLDIAGTGMLKKDDHYRTKEGPGTGVRLLAAFARSLINNMIIQK